MKKIIIISVALTGLLVGALIFYGCKKDTQEGSLMKQDAAMTPTNLNFGDPNTYGILHNEIAEYVLSQDISLIDKNVFANASIEEHYRIIDSCISYCVKAGYLGDDDAILVRKKLYEVFYNFWQHTLIKNSSIDFFKDVLASDGFSDNMIMALSAIREMARSSSSSAQNTDRQYVDILESNPYSLTSEELFQMSIAQSVTTHSRYFWVEQPFNRKPKPPQGWTCDEWVIFMDALGAVHGMIFGPIFSIIEGAALSIATKKNCEDW